MTADRTIGLILGTAAVGIGLGWLYLWHEIRGIRRRLEPGRDQAEFADTLQLANGEDEAQQLLQRHLERTLPATAAVVLNRNNSADRLEAVTPLPPGSPLAGTLRGAEPRSCLAVRSGRMHRENGGRPPLLSCPVCAPVPGASSCVPLTVGGEVIGSVLLSRPAPYSEAEEQRIRESVSQAAPVLANLRNLAVAEIRAATDGLTGLPNKRAVTDALKRTFAQAATDEVAARAAPARPRPLQAGQRPARARRWGTRSWPSVGAALRSVLRNQDFAGRNGGEEFAILLPDTEIAAALEIAERVRAAIAEISLPGTDVPVTVSIGVAGFPGHASTLDRLERLADAALYVAKRQGRNRVELAEPASADAVPDQPGPPADDSGPVPVPVPRDARALPAPALAQAQPRPRYRSAAMRSRAARAASHTSVKRVVRGDRPSRNRSGVR